MTTPIRSNIPAIALALLLSPASFAGQDAPAKGGGRDSLRLILSSEMENQSKVIRLKNPLAADSLIRRQIQADRKLIDALIGNAALAEEIRTQEEFRAYWKKAEIESGLAEYKARFTARDIDKGRIPRLYMFDSSVVVYPGWVIVRRKPRSHEATP